MHHDVATGTGLSSRYFVQPARISTKDALARPCTPGVADRP